MIERLESLVSNKIENYENACKEMQSVIETYIKQMCMTLDCEEIELTNKNVFPIRMYNSYTDEYEYCKVERVRYTNNQVEIGLCDEWDNNEVWHNINDMLIDYLPMLFHSVQKECEVINFN